jgi:hypothetical protein
VSLGRRALLLFAFSALFLTRPTVSRADDFVLIRNSSNPVPAVSRDHLFKIYTGQSKQFGGAVTQTVIGEEGSGELKWLAALFGMRPKDLLSRIRQEVFRGEMKRPIVAKSAADAFAAVQNNAGGVAVVPASAARSLPDGVAFLALN